ncbi:MAG: hypothetical protein IPM68_14755 [Flavobacteriales bacterium]|nr:hypothetical protein [Flavobacteriales bacterium]
MVRLLFTALLLLLITTGRGQCLDSLGVDGALGLNRCEEQVLADLGVTRPLAEARPVVAFRFGNQARRIGKADFFQRILPWLRRGERPGVQTYALTEQERQNTGVDAVVVAWSKVGWTRRTKRRVMNDLMRERSGCARPG